MCIVVVASYPIHLSFSPSLSRISDRRNGFLFFGRYVVWIRRELLGALYVRLWFNPLHFFPFFFSLFLPHIRALSEVAGPSSSRSCM